MYTKDKAEMLKYHHEKMANLMTTTMVSNETSFHPIDEATVHLIEHFTPMDTREQQYDHCLLIGEAYFGKSAENCDRNVSAAAHFMAGDVHALSHTIAHHMKLDPLFCEVVKHALEIYNQFPQPNKDN